MAKQLPVWLEYVARLRIGLPSCPSAARLVVDAIGCGEQFNGEPMVIKWLRNSSQLTCTDDRRIMGGRDNRSGKPVTKAGPSAHSLLTNQPPNQTRTRTTRIDKIRDEAHSKHVRVGLPTSRWFGASTVLCGLPCVAGLPRSGARMSPHQLRQPTSGQADRQEDYFKVETVHARRQVRDAARMQASEAPSPSLYTCWGSSRNIPRRTLDSKAG